jgi:hypothetical protein
MGGGTLGRAMFVPPGSEPVKPESHGREACSEYAL